MKLKERKWSICSKCGHNLKIIQEESYGCDLCKKTMKEGSSRLEIIIFQRSLEPIHHQLCSWKCVFKFLRKVKSDYFVNLPYLSFDEKTKGKTVSDFWKCIKNM